MIQHEKYMRRCIELASCGEGKVSPNPLVGAVVLDKNGDLAAEGFHEKYGEAHAEVNALTKAGNRAKEGTLYINLEPCCHFGKTPPCTDRVIEAGIKRLVVGMTDPNPQVAGKGLKKIRNAGIEVIENVLEKECLKLNEIFIKNITKQKPFIAIKTASTIDGKIAAASGKSKWITSEKARKEVHRLRNKYDALLTGSGTIIADDPSLDCRISGGRNPVVIVVDSSLVIPESAKIFKNSETKIILAAGEETNTDKKYPLNTEIIKCPLKNNKINLEYLVSELYKKGIYSIMIESGGILNGIFLKYGLLDKIYFFLAPKLMGDKKAPASFEGFAPDSPEECSQLVFGEAKSFSPDLMVEAYVRS